MTGLSVDQSNKAFYQGWILDWPQGLRLPRVPRASGHTDCQRKLKTNLQKGKIQRAVQKYIISKFRVRRDCPKLFVVNKWVIFKFVIFTPPIWLFETLLIGVTWFNVRNIWNFWTSHKRYKSSNVNFWSVEWLTFYVYVKCMYHVILMHE